MLAWRAFTKRREGKERIREMEERRREEGKGQAGGSASAALPPGGILSPTCVSLRAAASPASPLCLGCILRGPASTVGPLTTHPVAEPCFPNAGGLPPPRCPKACPVTGSTGSLGLSISLSLALSSLHVSVCHSTSACFVSVVCLPVPSFYRSASSLHRSGSVGVCLSSPPSVSVILGLSACLCLALCVRLCLSLSFALCVCQLLCLPALFLSLSASLIVSVGLCLSVSLCLTVSVTLCQIAFS